MRIGRGHGEHVSGGEVDGCSHRERGRRRAGGKLDRATGNGAAERGAGGKARSAAEDVAQDHRAAGRLPRSEVGEVIRRQIIEDMAFNVACGLPQVAATLQCDRPALTNGTLRVTPAFLSLLS